MIKKLLFLCLACVFVFGVALDEKQKQFVQNIAPSDEMSDYTQNIIDPLVATSPLVLSLQEYKKSYLVGEVFALELSAKTTETTQFDLQVAFEKNDELVFLNSNIHWDKINDEYHTTLWFEAKNTNAKLNKIFISLSKNEEVFQKASLTLSPLKFIRINAEQDYSNIVAEKLEATRVKTSFFDDKNLLVNIEFLGINTNLKDFFLKDKDIIDQRIDNVRGDFNASAAYYSAILSPSKKSLDFSYYNTQSQEFEKISLEIKPDEQNIINIQSDLNPKNNTLDLYKQVALYLLSLVCVLIFIFKRSYIILIIAVLSFTASFFVSTQTHTGIIKANAKAKILPTEQSSSFYISDEAQEVEILGKRQHYVKILLKDGKIGWIDEQDLQKN